MGQWQSHAWIQQIRQLFQRPWLPLLLGIIGTIAVFGLWHQLSIKETDQIQHIVQEEGRLVETVINREMVSRMQALERMVERWQAKQGTPKSLWDLDASAYLRDLSGFQAIEWVDPSFQVRWIRPIEGNEDAQNLDLTQDAHRYQALRIARDLRQPFVTNTLTLVQGGKGFFANFPIFVGERFDGFIVGVFWESFLFDSILLVPEGFHVRIYDRRELIYNSGGNPQTPFQTTFTIEAYGVDWQVEVFPTPTFVNGQRSRLLRVVLWGGFIGAWTLALVAHLAQKAVRQAQKTQIINQQLEHEIEHRQETEINLRQSEERLQLALEASAEAWWDWNMKTGVVNRSPQYLKLLGYEVGEFPDIVNSWETSIHPDDFAGMMERLTDHLQDGSVPYSCEYRIRTKSGEWQWISDYGKVVARDVANQPLRMIGTFRDIADRKRAESALAESQQRYQNLIENSPDIIERFDLQLRHLYVSPVLTKLTGLPTEAFLGKTCRDLGMDENMIKTWETAAARLLETGQKQVIEFATLTLEGMRSFEMAIAPEMTNVGTISSILCISRDITERKQTETALRQSEEKFRVLVTQSPVGILQTDAQGRCVYVNPRWTEMTGLAFQSAMGDGWIQALHPENREKIFQEWVQATQADRPFNLEYRFQKPDGTVLWVSGQTIAVRNDQGEVIRYFGTVMDITARKEAEATKQALIESIPDFLVRMRRDGVQLEVLNRGNIQMLQSDIRDVPGTHITKVLPSTIAEERLELTQQALASGTIQTQEYQFEVNGTVVYEEARIAPLGVDEVLVVVRDITERYRAEQALRESEEKFRQLAENIHQVFFILSVEGDMLYISPAYEQVWQRSRASLYANPHSWLESIHPDDQEKITATLHNQIALKQAFHETYRIVRQDGEIRWITSHSFPLRDETGTVVRFTGIAEDITQQKQAEAALRQSEATKQAIIEAIPDLLIRMQPDGTYLDFISNSEFNLIQPTLIRKNASLDEVLPPDLAQIRLYHTQRALQSGSTAIYDQEIVIEGKQRYEEVRIVPLQENEVLVMIRDITDRKQAETDLKHQKEMLQTIVNHIPVMIALFNADGRIGFVNPEFETVLGWSLEEWQQRDALLDCYPDPVDYQTAIAHMTAANGRWQDFTTRTKTGQVIETSWTNVHLSDGSNLGIGQDISDRKRKELALQQAMESAEAANLAKSMFLANMSHELRTPLNVILGFAQVMTHDPSLTPNQLQDLRTIRRSGDHLLSLINDVLDLSKIEAGHASLDKTGIDLISMLHSLRSMMTERANAKHLQLIFEIAPEVPPFIIADEQKLRQVLLNLLSNAIKFTSQGSVILRANVDGQAREPQQSLTLQFEVSDTGIGIPPEEQTMIFDAFVQAEAGKKSVSGTGLGLTISRKLLELMDGTITVQSRPNVGSTFICRVPVRSTSGVNIQPEQHDRTVIGLVPGQPHYRILVVDDQRENRLLMVRLLSQLGLVVREATNGHEAVQTWQDWQPDLIWMDIRMPGMDGYEATRWIREYEQSVSHAATPSPTIIIALTAQASQSDRTLALAAGCNDYISKPIREETLFLKLSEYLGLKYVYAALDTPSDLPSTVSSEIDPIASSILLSPDLVDHLPTAWLQTLDNAARCGNDLAIVELTTQLPPELASLSHYLTDLANKFQFEHIIDWVSHHSPGGIDGDSA